jgi:hypothetical protein
MVGDVNRGAVTLEESANGINITGTWLGEVVTTAVPAKSAALPSRR